MSQLFLSPRKGSSSAIGICDRCRTKKYLVDLKPDGDIPGLMVCRKCWDQKDRYKLAPRRADDTHLPFYRPDTELSISISIEYLTTIGLELITTQSGEPLEVM